MNGKQLKNSILQWAIQGKLVPQDPNDEPASVLLERIRAEKERLIKEKKIKRSKNESIIYRGEDNSYYEKFEDGTVKCIDDEIPFEIPQGWEWERWGNVSYSIQYGYNAPAKPTGDILMVRISDIQNNQVVWDGVPYCDIEEKEIPSYLLRDNDILFARTGGTVGKSFLVKQVPERAIYAGYLIRTQYSTSNLCPEYLKAFMESQLYWDQLKKGTIATAQPNCNGQTLGGMLLPIPPFTEQIHITEKLALLTPILQKYSVLQDTLEYLNNGLNIKLKKSILQEAIQGKLISQDPNDEPASVLLERIRAEKERLIKEKKIKRDKNESVIYKGDDNSYYEIVNGKTLCINDEIPFDIPESWTWVRGKSVFLPMESTHPEGEQFCCVDVDAVDNKQNTITRPKHLQSNQAPSRATRKLHTSDILFSLVRPYLRNIALVDATHSKSIASTGFYVITPNESLYPQYVFYLMLSSYVIDGLNQFMKGDNSPSINNAHIENWLYPLPPLVEQRRIVDRIKELSAHFK